MTLPDYLRYKKLFVPVLLLLFISATNAVFAQSGEDTTVKNEVIVGDPNQDSAEGILDEYKQYDTDKNSVFNNKNLYSNEDSLPKKSLPADLVKRMKDDGKFWYADYEFEKERQEELRRGVPFFQRDWVKTILWIIIVGGFATAIILFLYNSNVQLFRKKASTFAADKQAEESDNIFEINFRERIEKAVKEGNYRLAVRLTFLQMLKTMAGRNIIQYKQDRTNFDYLVQLRSTPHYDNFFRLARNYEYAWYGDFPVNDETWQLIRNDFEKFNSMISVK